MVDGELRDRLIADLRAVVQQPTLASVSEWEAKGPDRTAKSLIEDLQEQILMTMPIRPSADIEQQAIDANFHSIQRAILLLDSDYEFSSAKENVRDYWFLTLLMIGIFCFATGQYFEWLQFAGVVILGVLISILYLAFVGWHMLAGWRIFQVRVLRRDLTLTAMSADERCTWPFESRKVLESVLLTRKGTGE